MGEENGDNERSVVAEHENGVLTLTLSAPRTRNALSRELLNELIAALEVCSNDPELRVLVLTNEGPAFCAGADLKAAPTDPSASLKLIQHLFSLFDELVVPVVAGVNGHVRGGGVGIVAACDFVIASAHSTFSFAEVKIGVAPLAIADICIKAVGERQFLAHAVSGAPFSAERAFELGLVTQVCQDEKFDESLCGLIGTIATNAPGAVRETKSFVRGLRSWSADQAAIQAVSRSGALFSGPEAKEGIAAFFEKRSPSWKRPAK